MIGLKFKNSLATRVKIETIKTGIIEKLKVIPNINDLKLNVELTLFICRCIETEIKKKQGVVKKELFFEIISSIFTTLTRDDTAVLEQQIQFLHDNNSIKQSSLKNYITNSLYSWLERKIL
jgi:hypothetical protein